MSKLGPIRYTPYRQPIPEAVLVRADGTEEVLWGHTYQCYRHGAGRGERCPDCKREWEALHGRAS